MALWSSVHVPKTLRGKADALAVQARLSAGFFHHPSEAKAIVAREARRKFAKSAVSSLKGDWCSAARALTDSSDHLAWAVEETLNFEVPKIKLLSEMAVSLKHGALALGKALTVFGRPQRCEEALTDVRRWALQAERIHRDTLKKALNDPNVVSELKLKTVARRLSEAAEGLQRAADDIAALLALSAS